MTRVLSRKNPVFRMDHWCDGGSFGRIVMATRAVLIVLFSLGPGGGILVTRATVLGQMVVLKEGKREL